MAEAESVLHKRPKMASSALLSIEDAFLESSALEEANKGQTTVAPTSPPAFQETAPDTNGCVSSPVLSPPIVTPAKPSTLKKSGKKKPNKSSKDLNSKHSKKTFYTRFDQCDGDSEECPYSDLESVPKILCPKALERQKKSPAPVQPPVAAAKEVKKQPEVQTGLWFSKSGKDRRPKTISPVPDRTLFGKVPNRKRSSPVVGKKPLAPASASGPTDHSGLPEKPKTPVPAETNPTSEQAEQLKCKNGPAATRTSDRAAHSAEKPLVPVEAGRPSHKGGHSKGRHIVNDTRHHVTRTEADNSDSKKASKPNTGGALDGQSRISHSVKDAAQPEQCEDARKAKPDAKSAGSEGGDVQEAPGDGLDVKAAEREEQARLMAKCRMPFVKLIRKEVQVGNASVSAGSSDHPECTDIRKALDASVTRVPKKSECAGSSASVSVGQEAKSEPAKVAVKKVKASSGTSLLCLSSEPVKIFLSSNMSKLSETGRPEEERRRLTISPNTGAHPPPPPPTPPPAPSRKPTQSPELSDSSDPAPPAPAPSQQPVTLDSTSVPSNESSKGVVPKPKRSSGKVSKHVLPEQPAHLPASNRLMTRALKAMQEQEKCAKARKVHKQQEALVACASKNSTRTPEAKLETNARCKNNGELDRDTFSSCSTPTAVSSDTTDFEADVKSEDEDLSISSTPPMDFIPLTSRIKSKKEDHSPDVCSSSLRSSPFSFVNAFKNLEEVSFQSLTNEADGKPVSFKANKNYKYSTILMMLKDLHDARERDGTPLELQIGPPSAHVKKEPLVMPGELTTPGSRELAEQINDNNHLNPNKFTQNEERPWLVSRRPCSHKGNSTRIKKKANRRVPSQPSRSGPGFPGLESPAAVDSSGVASPVQSVLDLKSSNWERLTGGHEGVTRDETKRWSRVAEDLENMVPLEQRACSAALCLEQPNGLLADYSETGPRLMRNVGEGDRSRTGKEREFGRLIQSNLIKPELELYFILFHDNIWLP